MIDLIPAIIAVGSIAALALWLAKRFYGTKADQKKVIKLQEEVDEISNKMAQLIRNRHRYTFDRYNKLNAHRMQLNRKIARLRKTLGNK